jgi:hypothetical protein
MNLWSGLVMPESEKKYKLPTEQERLEVYFGQLEQLIPNPHRDWAKAARPCKWAKILEEKKNNPDGSGQQ